MRRIPWISCLIAVLILACIPASALARAEDTQPKVALVVSLQRDTIKVNAPVVATVWVSNQSTIPVQNARLLITAPDFLVLHVGSCDAPVQDGPIELGPLVANSTLAEPVSLCFTLDRSGATTGAYNILTSVVYQWEQGSDQVSVEKALKVDFIGVDNVLGIPIGIAGFVLPGLMLLIVLRWFKAPWVKDFQTNDQLLAAVLISLILLGPVSWLAALPGAPRWAVWLDFQQQVSIERLGAYILIGVVLGALGGVIYTIIAASQSRKAKAHEAWLQIKPEDVPPLLLKKAAQLNPSLQQKRIVIRRKTNKFRIIGGHSARQNGQVVIFSQCVLILKRLPEETRAKVRAAVGSVPASVYDVKQLQAVLAVLDDDKDRGAFLITNPILEETRKDELTPVNDTTYQMKVDEALYESPELDDDAGALLEILEEEPY